MLTEQEKSAISHVTGELSAAPIFVDDTPDQGILDIRTKARRMKQEHGVEMIVVDYLQKISTHRKENREQQIAAISRGLKNLARELYIPVLVPTQLNRGSESEQRLPRTSDLRESGAIEQDADEILLMHRHSVAHRGDQEWMDQNPTLNQRGGCRRRQTA
jgi:replicative DNA helicase